MEKIENKQLAYEEPLLEIVPLTTADPLALSGWEGEPQEGEIIPVKIL